MRAVNLIPRDQRGGSSVGAGRSQGAVYAVLGTVAGLALMALLYGMAHHQVTTRTAQEASLTARAQQAQTAASRLAPYTAFVALREQRMAAVQQLANSRFDWAHVFHEFARVLPSDASISSLNGSVGAVSATGASTSAATAASATVSSATPPGSLPTFSVAGCATSQTAVAQTLDRLRLIDGVSSVTLQSSTKSGAGGGGGAAGCLGTEPAFSVQVTFQPLPVQTATSAGTATVASTSAGVPR